MALYTILFGLSIFMIALVVAIIKKMFFHWKEEHKIDNMVTQAMNRPTVSMMIYTGRCIVKRRVYGDKLEVYDVIDKSEISIQNLEQNPELVDDKNEVFSDSP